MLRLVPPPGTGQGKRSRNRYVSLSLTPEEASRLRIVLKNLRVAYGTWACLADAMGVTTSSVKRAASDKGRSSPGILLRAARAGGITVERLLGGTLAIAGKCPHCGRST